jgi:hypothetical protein
MGAEPANDQANVKFSHGGGLMVHGFFRRSVFFGKGEVRKKGVQG